jgi:uncharacterized protein
MSDQPTRINAYLVAGGRYHDIDFARLELLKLLAEHEEVRVTVGSDYEDTDAIAACTFLVSYTCDIRPSEKAQRAIRAWVEGGGKWMALHGTNAALDLPRPNGVEAPRCFPTWANTLGSQFIAHPPIQMYPVELADPNHPIVAGFEPFETDDELYLSEYHDRDKLHVLLHTHWHGDARGFNEHDWTTGNDEHLVLYILPWPLRHDRRGYGVLPEGRTLLMERAAVPRDPAPQHHLGRRARNDHINDTDRLTEGNPLWNRPSKSCEICIAAWCVSACLKRPRAAWPSKGSCPAFSICMWARRPSPPACARTWPTTIRSPRRIAVMDISWPRAACSGR